MSVRISELENEEVDYLRFDRIKIQRKRMQHILEVIKDLTFKNKELVKQTHALQLEIEQQRHFRNLYDDLEAQKQALVDKNLSLTRELAKYRETALHQEMLINTLKEELTSQAHRRPHTQHYHTQPNFLPHDRPRPDAASILYREQPTISQQYEVLKAQYRELQDQYSKLYKQQFKSKENLDLTGHIYSQHKDHSQELTSHGLRKVRSFKSLEADYSNETVSLGRLREKYQKLKKVKKQLVRCVKEMECQLDSYRQRQENLLDLVELLKGKKTKICLCHVNKLQKQMKSTLTQLN